VALVAPLPMARAVLVVLPLMARAALVAPLPMDLVEPAAAHQMAQVVPANF
jgi:hypothetical protein